MDYILLKYISKKEFLDDFLNGSLYMNTLYFYWGRKALDEAKKRRDNDLRNNPNLNPRNYAVPIEENPGPGRKDLFEGAVTTEKLTTSNLPDDLKVYAQTDPVYLSVGMGYCNTLCFFKMDYKLMACGKFGTQVKCYLGDMQEFGDYVVIVDDLDELIRRVHKAARRSGFMYSCGPVQYKKMKRNGGNALLGHYIAVKEEFMHDIKDVKLVRDAFVKMDHFAYQCEWRVALYRGVKDKEAYRLEVGNLRDIVHWVKREDLNSEIRRIFMYQNFKPPTSCWYGDDRRKLRNLFCKLGDYKAERFSLLGGVKVDC